MIIIKNNETDLKDFLPENTTILEFEDIKEHSPSLIFDGNKLLTISAEELKPYALYLQNQTIVYSLPEEEIKPLRILFDLFEISVNFIKLDNSPDIEILEEKKEELKITSKKDISAKRSIGLNKIVQKIFSKVEGETDIKIFLLDDKPKKYKGVVASGFWNLDYIIFGPGGIVPGRVYELFGPEGSGKTTICNWLLGKHQERYKDKDNSVAIFIDIEHAFVPERAQALGVDLNKLALIQPDIVDEAIDALKILLDSAAKDEIHISCIVFDSIAAIQTEAESNQSSGGAEMMGRARFLSKLTRQIPPRLSKAKVPMFMINQVRDNITAMGARGYTTPGGRAIKHAFSGRFEIKRKDFIGHKDNPEGQIITVKSVKNRFAPPHKTAEIMLYYDDKPFRTEESFIDFGIHIGTITRKGGSHYFKDIRLATSRGELLSKIQNMDDDLEFREIYQEMVEDAKLRHFGEAYYDEEVEDTQTINYDLEKEEILENEEILDDFEEN